MPKNKRAKYKAIKSFQNVFEIPYSSAQEDFKYKGKWHKDFFKNDYPIVLELGCGKGEYSVALAQRYPEKNFIGVDIKGDRLYKGAVDAIEKELPNVAFIRSQIQFVTSFFVPNEVDEIWLTFPDPQLQKPRHRKRLTAPEFLKKYSNIIRKNGIVHLKTDNTELFEFTIDVVKNMNQKMLCVNDDIYALPAPEEVTGIKTYYEELFAAKGEKIKYLSFALNI